jgi:hypothetical protein
MASMNRNRLLATGNVLERVTGIEPAWPAWKAALGQCVSNGELQWMPVCSLFRATARHRRKPLMSNHKAAIRPRCG